MQSTEAIGSTEGLATRRGMLILLLLCVVQFLDILDASIVNVALPSIKHDLGFSQQSLQWVVSGYVIAYGGFLLLGGRAADLLGRRRILVSGVMLFALASSQVAWRRAQGSSSPHGWPRDSERPSCLPPRCRP
jgi:MFS family permease